MYDIYGAYYADARITRSTLKTELLNMFGANGCNVMGGDAVSVDEDVISRPAIRHCCLAKRDIMILPRSRTNLMGGYETDYFFCPFCRKAYYCNEAIPSP